ncbi:MAG: addiction module protein, partial [Spirochaetales bacterium]|nr:addiction module protein [Spirochaetales bacterium]
FWVNNNFTIALLSLIIIEVAIFSFMESAACLPRSGFVQQRHALGSSLSLTTGDGGAGLKERIEIMRIEQLAKEVMNLSLEERAELAQRLLISLDEAPPSEIERLWMQEAERRLQEFRKGNVQGIPSEDVFRRAISEIS